MENFIVSARKYRPKQFEEVVGQGHITRTLENAIAQNHLAQALLFTGPRGVGKTTCARILAKVINTDGSDDDTQDFSFNIIELDAASNNSVDDIRALTDQVRFAPQTGQYKVYIIDEVHMLSQQAFNAFLKTLEEPPKHAIFILATTEKHKIIPTILSRCQIFDFKRISVEDIAKHLKKVADKEGIKAEPEALYTIATKADGALRDSLSIFDRVVSFSGDTITYKNVIDNLRILDYDYYFKTTDLIYANDKAGLLLLFKEILDNGFDGHLYVNGLASHFRDLLVCKNPKTLKLLEVSKAVRERYQKQSGIITVAFIMDALRITAEVDYRYKSSNNQNLLVEICLLNLTELANTAEKKNADSEIVAPAKEKKIPEAPAKIHKDVTTPALKQAAETSGTRGVEKEETQPQALTAEPKPAKIIEPQATTTETESQKLEEEKVVYNKPTEPTKPPVAKARGRRSSFSINNAMQQTKVADDKEEEDPLAPKLDRPKDSITQEQLNAVWADYLVHLETQQEKKLLNTIRNKKVEVTENNTLAITLEGEIQRNLFTEGQAELLGFLRNKLNNYSMVFSITVAEASMHTVPYSADEKFQYLAKKNPAILLLKEKLKLDIR